MRTLLKIKIDTEAGNKALRDGLLPEIMQGIAQEIKPEAAYFTAEGGKRTAFYFFDMKDSSQIPSIAETAFMRLHAEVEFIPVMNQDDLTRGLANLKTKIK